MKKFPVRWSKQAKRDLDHVVAYICRENPKTAFKIFRSLRAQAGKLSDFPQRGRIVPELTKLAIDSCRELLVPPWRILYRLFEKQIIVIAVIDSRRDLQSFLSRRDAENFKDSE